MRLRILSVSGELILGMCKHGVPAVRVVATALPADASLRAVYVDPLAPNTFIMQIESAAFEDVPDGGMAQNHPPIMFRRLLDGEIV